MINMTKDTKITDLTKEYPWLLDEVVKLDDRLKILKTPVGKLMIKKATIGDAADKTGLSVEDIIKQISELIEAH